MNTPSMAALPRFAAAHLNIVCVKTTPGSSDERWRNTVQRTLAHPHIQALAARLDDRFILTHHIHSSRDEVTIEVALPKADGMAETHIQTVTSPLWLSHLWKKAFKQALTMQNQLAQRGLLSPEATTATQDTVSFTKEKGRHVLSGIHTLLSNLKGKTLL